METYPQVNNNQTSRTLDTHPTIDITKYKISIYMWRVCFAYSFTVKGYYGPMASDTTIIFLETLLQPSL